MAGKEINTVRPGIFCKFYIGRMVAYNVRPGKVNVMLFSSLIEEIRIRFSARTFVITTVGANIHLDDLDAVLCKIFCYIPVDPLYIG